jgi:hypothetical protein
MANINTSEASIHTGCWFALKGGTFVLTSAEADGGDVRMVFNDVAEVLPQRESLVTKEGLDTTLWNLTQCNNTTQHWPQV